LKTRKKACHNLYKFDSKTEKDFAIILEEDNTVLKWMRPAERQFHIYWNHNSRRYFPDFVVETADAIFMVETKMESEINSDSVQEKARAALEYCKYASDFTAQNSGKPWKYVLIPHSSVMRNMEFDRLAKSFEKKNR
jgi:type III restriction enzyme